MLRFIWLSHITVKLRITINLGKRRRRIFSSNQLVSLQPSAVVLTDKDRSGLSSPFTRLYTELEPSSSTFYSNSGLQVDHSCTLFYVTDSPSSIHVLVMFYQLVSPAILLSKRPGPGITSSRAWACRFQFVFSYLATLTEWVFVSQVLKKAPKRHS